jgi:hypothetical protein
MLLGLNVSIRMPDILLANAELAYNEIDHVLLLWRGTGGPVAQQHRQLLGKV